MVGDLEPVLQDQRFLPEILSSGSTPEVRQPLGAEGVEDLIDSGG
jgi:hypothetical protein